jgi:hypothetical protein
MNTTETIDHHGHRVPRHIVCAIDALISEKAKRQYPQGLPTEAAEYAAGMALLAAREAAWWGVLAHWTFAHSDLPMIYGRAALLARQSRMDQADRWRRSAREWRRHAEQAHGAGEVTP